MSCIHWLVLYLNFNTEVSKAELTENVVLITEKSGNER